MKQRLAHTESERPPRFFHLTTTIKRGGAENHLVDLIRAQRRGGYATVVCAYLKGTPYWQAELEGLGVPVINLQMKSYTDLGTVFRLKRELKRFSPDVLHVHGAPAEIFATAARMFSSQPRLLFTRHEPRRRLFNLVGYQLTDKVLSRAVDGIIAVSHSVLGEDVARQPVLKNKSRVVHHGVPEYMRNLPDFNRDQYRSTFGARKSTVLIGLISQHVHEKSIDTMLLAYAQLLSLGGAERTKVIIIGTGPLSDKLKKLADDLELSKNVLWFDFRDDIPEFLNSLDIFVLPSREEGFGIVLLEAMASGLPILACAVDAIPEVVVDGVTGILVPSGDATAMSRGLIRLVSDPDLRSRMGTAGRERAARDFSLENMWQNTNTAYQELLKIT